MTSPPVKAQAMWAFEAQGLTIVEDHPPTSIVRTRDASEESLRAIGDALGVAWPLAPNSTSGGPTLRVCWLGPQEWAVFGHVHEDVSRFLRDVDNLLSHVADMRDAWTRWRVTGANAERLLSMGCPLNLHPRTFAADATVRTLLGQVAIVLVRDGKSFSVHTETALTAHLRAWFERAGASAAIEHVRWS